MKVAVNASTHTCDKALHRTRDQQQDQKDENYEVILEVK